MAEAIIALRSIVALRYRRRGPGEFIDAHGLGPDPQPNRPVAHLYEITVSLSNPIITLSTKQCFYTKC